MDVRNFEETHKLIQKLGFKVKAYQENKRTSYRLDNVEIELDTWPLIPSYIEIKGKNKVAKRTTITSATLQVSK